MVTYLKIRIRRGDPAKGENQMVYPDVYDAREVDAAKQGPILYPGEIGKGASEEHCVVCFHNAEVAKEYLKDKDITKLTKIQVNKFMRERWTGRKDPEERVMDPNRLTAIVAKQNAGMKLSQEDQDALDPDKRVPGINRVNKDSNIFEHRFKADNKR